MSLAQSGEQKTDWSDFLCEVCDKPYGECFCYQLCENCELPANECMCNAYTGPGSSPQISHKNNSGSSNKAPCMYFAMGRCNFGDTCKYSHTLTSSSAPSNNQEVCKFFLSGNCRFGSTCRFSHTITQNGTKAESTKVQHTNNRQADDKDIRDSLAVKLSQLSELQREIEMLQDVLVDKEEQAVTLSAEIAALQGKLTNTSI